MARRNAPAVAVLDDELNDHVANESEGLDQFDEFNAETEHEVLPDEPPRAVQTSAPLDQGSLKFLPIDEIVESHWNPRRHFDEAKLADLAASIRELGVLTPLLARPIDAMGTPAGYELAAGHRRFRAAKIAGIRILPVMVRTMTDRQLREVLTIENLQRDDVHALEEAQGYADLVKHDGYTAQRIADRVGKSVEYVYAQIKLLELIEPAKQLLRDGRIEPGHAILIARLKPEDQKRAIDPKSIEALWRLEHPLLDWREEDGREHLKTVTVLELKGWIDRNVRLDPKRDSDPMFFPEMADAVTPVLAQSLKVVPITREYRVPDGARSEERTYGEASWRRADGQQRSKTCDFSVMGYVAAGFGRGEAFHVCVNKDKCKVHWKDEVARKEKRAKEAKRSAAPSTKTDPKAAEREQAKAAAAEAKQKAEGEKVEAEKKRYDRAKPELLEAIGAHIKQMSAAPGGTIGKLVFEEIRTNTDWRALNKIGPLVLSVMGKGKTADDLVRACAFMMIAATSFDEWNGRGDLAAAAKSLGFDLEKSLDAIAPLPTPEKADKAKPAKKAAAKKARR